MFISDTLESQTLLSGNNGSEFHLVSVYDASKPTQKLHVGVWYRPPHDREATENLYFILESFVVRVFFLLLYFCEILISISSTNNPHSFYTL